ncbi:DUF418 domain-containing protein [Sphingomonas psychrotolerans]|uniref:DUF418 domain-containing protein n=1 Tax=Sphingomonas psychrotolerans TaxID=1327635 RepID=A0A2K8MQ42_9SPHN|nr:DUF418 domain-containing protein [Sphingomonas psychrotolerans]ATY34109.1 hypothetical protein CVN68_20900 [Sphingomonas psychrotolerans]
MDAAPPPHDARGPGRLPALDVVRGVAVLGILLLNIVSFGLPEAAYLNPRAYGGWHGADLAAWLVNFVLFDGKMRGLFSFLFGASMLLVIERAEASGENAAKVHYRRMLWLLAFGLAHLWLIWHGDILTHYALVGMAAFALRNLPTGRMLVLGVMLVAASTVLFATIPLMVHHLQCCASGPAQAAEYARDLQGFARSMGVPSAADLARELALYRGDYRSIVGVRLGEHVGTPLILLWFYGPETLAYMLFGMAAFRSGLLRGEWPRYRYRRWLLICWGVALPAFVGLAFYLVREQFNLLPVVLVWVLTVPLRPPMIVGWACLILLLARPGGTFTERLAAAGRMAFTNYLATSLICTSLFYGYGLGWFGHLSRWQLYPVVLAIWAMILLWSKPWLARFRFGPLEWVWRSLARGRWQSFRGAASV